MTDPLVERVTREVEDPLTDLGLDLDAVEISSSGSKRVLRIAVDADGGVSIDRITQATRAVSATLDAGSAMGEQPYTLEVTSRGLSRPLELPRHWRRNAGRLVAVTLHDGPAVTGRVVGSDDDGVELAVADQQRRLRYDEIAKAIVTPELSPPKPTTPGRAGGSSPRHPHRGKDA